MVDHGFESDHVKTTITMIFVVSPLTLYVSLRRKSKDWLALNQDNVSTWSDISTRGLLFQ